MARAKEKPKKNIVLGSQDLAKKYPGSGVAASIVLPRENLIWIPSRCIPLNYAMGGGTPYGHICENFGEESSGKTLAALDFGYSTLSLGGEIIFNDAQQSFTADWAEKNGLNLKKIHLYNSTSVEYVSDWLADTALSIRSRLKSNEPILFIQDSLAALDCDANINSTSMDAKAEMGNRAKAIYKMLRIRNQMLAELGVTCIFINQLRKKVGAGMFEDPDTTPGGAAMKFYAHQRVGFYAGKQITNGSKTNKERWGVETSIRLKKNKVAPPRPTFKADIYFNPESGKPIGFDKYEGLFDVLLATDTITRSGSSVYLGNTKIATSEDCFYEKIEEDDDLRGKLIRRSGINTISKTRKLLESQTKNLYPVTMAKVEKQSSIKDEDEDDDV